MYDYPQPYIGQTQGVVNKILTDPIDDFYTYILLQGMVDGSASKPALRHDTGYMVETTYLDIAPYLGAFGAYLMPQ